MDMPFDLDSSRRLKPATAYLPRLESTGHPARFSVIQRFALG